VRDEVRPVPHLSYGRRVASVLESGEGRQRELKGGVHLRVFRPRLLSVLGAATLAATFVLGGAVGAAAATGQSATCTGGSIASGTYGSLDITGVCRLDSGNVVVRRSVTIESGGGLEALFSGSDLTVGRNLLVKRGGLLALGCEPGDLPCMNDATAHTNHTIFGNLVAGGAVLMIVHRDYIRGDVTQSGGGGGLNCTPLFPNGPPPYTDYNDSTIGGDITVTGLHTCWDGFLTNTIGGTVNWNDNHTVIPDGNLVSTSTIRGDLNCFGNSPKPHLSDITPVKNVVFGDARGQCAALSVTV
jgi:hypothetical protein